MTENERQWNKPLRGIEAQRDADMEYIKDKLLGRGRMTEVELRQELYKVLLGARQHGILDDTEIGVDDMCVIGIRMIFDLFKQAGYVQLDPDQSLPEIPKQLNDIIGEAVLYAYKDAQAEISYKAGYKQGVKNHHECCKMDYQEGIRKVVEWVEERHIKIPDGVPVEGKFILKEDWQTFKKEIGE